MYEYEDHPWRCWLVGGVVMEEGELLLHQEPLGPKEYINPDPR
jgi:hypothetical protein